LFSEKILGLEQRWTLPFIVATLATLRHLNEI
jgi:hypothetical protein